MHFQHKLLLALPALAAAHEQIPLADKVKGWFNKASSYVTSAAAAMPSPVDTVTSKVAEQVVTVLTLENWKSILAPRVTSTGTEPDQWLIYIDGGNKSCFGMCTNTTLAWKEAVTLLSARPNAPTFAKLDCDTDQILCNMWAVGPPSIYHMLLPTYLPHQAQPPTTVRYKVLNRTASTAETLKNITELVVQDKIKEVPPYNGAFHPFEGIIHQLGIAVPLAYFLWAFSLMPTWMPMIIISLFSRLVMNRGMPQQRRDAGAQPGAAAN